MEIQYERKNTVSWKNDKCVTCKMPLKIDPLWAKTPDNEMSYGNFLFILNIYSVEQLKQLNHLLTRKILQNISKIYKDLCWAIISFQFLYEKY